MAQSWQTKAQERMQQHMNRLFSQWLRTKPGQDWQRKHSHKSGGKHSPYYHGFAMPDYHREAIEAMNRDDEVTVKALMLAHYI